MACGHKACHEPIPCVHLHPARVKHLPLPLRLGTSQGKPYIQNIELTLKICCIITQTTNRSIFSVTLKSPSSLDLGGHFVFFEFNNCGMTFYVL